MSAARAVVRALELERRDFGDAKVELLEGKVLAGGAVVFTYTVTSDEPQGSLGRMKQTRCAVYDSEGKPRTAIGISTEWV